MHVELLLLYSQICPPVFSVYPAVLVVFSTLFLRLLSLHLSFSNTGQILIPSEAAAASVIRTITAVAMVNHLETITIATRFPRDGEEVAQQESSHTPITHASYLWLFFPGHYSDLLLSLPSNPVVSKSFRLRGHIQPE